MVPCRDDFKFGCVGMVTRSSKIGRTYQPVGDSAEGRHDDYAAALLALNYSFDMTQAFDRAYGCSAKFEYFHRLYRSVEIAVFVENRVSECKLKKKSPIIALDA